MDLNLPRSSSYLNIGSKLRTRHDAYGARHNPFLEATRTLKLASGLLGMRVHTAILRFWSTTVLEFGAYRGWGRAFRVEKFGILGNGMRLSLPEPRHGLCGWEFDRLTVKVRRLWKGGDGRKQNPHSRVFRIRARWGSARDS